MNLWQFIANIIKENNKSIKKIRHILVEDIDSFALFPIKLKEFKKQAKQTYCQLVQNRIDERIESGQESYYANCKTLYIIGSDFCIRISEELLLTDYVESQEELNDKIKLKPECLEPYCCNFLDMKKYNKQKFVWYNQTESKYLQNWRMQ